MPRRVHRRRPSEESGRSRSLPSAWMSGVRAAWFVGWTGASVAGCTTMLGIDSDYVAADQVSTGGRPTSGGADGGSGSASAPASGGDVASGGVPSVPDGRVEECTEGGDECGPGRHCCQGACADEAPASGCGDPTCTPCPDAPPFGFQACVDGACAFQCNDGFEPVADTCQEVPVASGGTTGSGGAASTGGAVATGGSSGASTTCTPQKCLSSGHSCTIDGPLQCCKSDGSCGCRWATASPCF